MLTIHYLGNEFLTQDNLAILMIPMLQRKFDGEIKFTQIDSFQDLIDMSNKKYFLDVCEGIKKVELINDVNDFAKFKRTTAHDLDFGFFLQLRNNLGEIDEIQIICLPIKKYKNLEEDLIEVIERVMHHE